MDDNFDPAKGTGNGFKFVEAEPGPLVEAAGRAATTFRRSEDWRTLIGNAMAADFSWERSAAAYLDLYRRLGAA